MQEIKLSELAKQEAYELDQRLSYCASVAFKEALAAQKADNNHVLLMVNSEAYKNFEKISCQGINVLAASYADSLFVSDDDTHIEHVKARLQFELNKYIPSDDHERQELLIPIMAYALIVNNEYNEEAVKKRIKADKKRVPSKSNSQYSYNRWKHIDPYAIKRSENPSKPSTLKTSLSALKRTIKKKAAYSICGTYYVISAYTLLNNYPILVRCQDVAKISLFLRCILTDSDNEKYPMKSLIRLYLANHLDNMLQRSYALCEGNHVKAIVDKTPQNNLLCCYYDAYTVEDRVRAINSTISPSFPQETESTSSKLVFGEDYTNLSFTEIYHDLVEHYSISHDDLNMLLDFYLDGETLTDYTDLITDTKDLTKSIICYINKNVKVSDYDITDAMMDLTRSILRRKRELPALYLNPNIKGSWHGTPLERYLCVPRIPSYKSLEAD